MELQVGETVCLHTAFVEQNYIRVQLTRTLHLDLFFTEPSSLQTSNFAQDKDNTHASAAATAASCD